MELTVAEIALKLTTEKRIVSQATARQRLSRLGFEPVRYIGQNNIYDLTEADIELLKNCKRGRRWPPKEGEAVAKPGGKAGNKAGKKPGK